VISLTVGRSGSLLGFRRKRRPYGVDPRQTSFRGLDEVLLRELEAFRFALAGLLQWALHWINVLVTRPTADRACRGAGGINLLFLPRREWLGLTSVVSRDWRHAPQSAARQPARQRSWQ
jgi:hypothetical protein